MATAVRLTLRGCAIAGVVCIAVWTARSFWSVDKVRWEGTAVDGALVTTSAFEARVVRGSMELVWRCYQHQIDYTEDGCGHEWVATLTGDDGLSLSSEGVAALSPRGAFYESPANWRWAGVGWYREGRLSESIRVLEAPTLVMALACGMPVAWGVVRMAARRRRDDAVSCPSCGYVLAGQTQCPECGAMPKERSIHTPRRALVPSCRAS